MTLLLARAVLFDLVTHAKMLDSGGSDVVVANVESILILEAVFDIAHRTGDVVLLVVVMIEIH
jgi:hypothetical protein